MSEQRISDEQLAGAIVRLATQSIDSTKTDSGKIHWENYHIALDLRDARDALKAKGGAFDAVAVGEEAHNRYRGFHPSVPELRNAFIFGAQYQSQLPAPSAPSPEPAPAVPTPLAAQFPTYREMLRDAFAVAAVSAGDFEGAYKTADLKMKHRDTK